MSEGKKARFVRGPQREHENKLKGQIVQVSSIHEMRGVSRGGVLGRLIWADVYSWGIQLNPQQPEISMIMKGPGIVLTKWVHPMPDWAQPVEVE